MLNYDVLCDYHINYYPSNYFDTIMDVGASVGQIALPLFEKHKNAKLYCYEPCVDNYNYLHSILNDDRVFINNLYLGDGTPLYFNQQKSSTHYFTKEGDDNYKIESYRLDEIVKNSQINLDSKMLLTIDTEGGERFLIDHKPSEQVIKQCCHFGLEIHYPNKSKSYSHFNDFPVFTTYNSWIYDNFNETHYIHFNNFCPTSGLGIFVLARRDQDVFI